MKKAADYYAVIQVDPRAEKDVIEAAYRRLASKYHPDVDGSPGATARMAEINAAYEVLSDPEKRRMYDLGRRSPFFGAAGRPARPAPRVDLSQWALNIALTVVLLGITAGGARLGPRVLLFAGVIALLVVLLMVGRKR